MRSIWRSRSGCWKNKSASGRRAGWARCSLKEDSRRQSRISGEPFPLHLWGLCGYPVGKEDGHAARGTGYLASDYMGGRQTSGQSSALHQKHAGRFRSNLMAITTLSSSNETKKARLKNGDKVLFGLAPLPFVTGLFPVVFEEEIDSNSCLR